MMDYFFEKLNKYFIITNQEKKILFLISSLFLIGLVVSIVNNYTSQSALDTATIVVDKGRTEDRERMTE